MPELKDKQSLFDRIREESRPFLNIPPQEDEFTLIDYINANSTREKRMNRNTAEARLKEMIEAGVVVKRKGGYNGKSVNVYRFKEEQL